VITVDSLNQQLPIAIVAFKVEMGTAGDPIMEDIAHHATQSLEKEILDKFRLPCLLLAISGPVIVIFCGAWTGEVFHYDYLASIVTHPSCHQGFFNQQARFWWNIKEGLKDLAAEVQTIDPTLQHGYPYPCSFKEGLTDVTFKYTSQIEKKHRVFKAT